MNNHTKYIGVWVTQAMYDEITRQADLAPRSRWVRRALEEALIRGSDKGQPRRLTPAAGAAT